MTFKTNTFAHTHRIEDGTNGSLGHNPRVEQLQRSRGRISGIGRDLFARRRQPSIHGTEVFQRHVCLAPDLDPLGWVRGLQLKRYRTQRPQVGRDIVAKTTVTAGDSQRQFAASIMKTERNPIHLRFHDQRHRAPAQCLANLSIPGGQGSQRVLILQTAPPLTIRFFDRGGLFGGQHLFQRKHRPLVLYTGKALGRRTAHALGGGFGSDQFRMGRLQLLELPVQPVIFEISDSRRRQNIIRPVMGQNLRRQTRVAGSGRLGGNIAHSDRLDHSLRALKPNEDSASRSNLFRKPYQNPPEERRPRWVPPSLPSNRAYSAVPLRCNGSQ